MEKSSFEVKRDQVTVTVHDDHSIPVMHGDCIFDKLASPNTSKEEIRIEKV